MLSFRGFIESYHHADYHNLIDKKLIPLTIPFGVLIALEDKVALIIEERNYNFAEGRRKGLDTSVFWFMMNDE